MDKVRKPSHLLLVFVLVCANLVVSHDSGRRARVMQTSDQESETFELHIYSYAFVR